MLEIIDLHASIGDTPILKGINLHVKPGQVHAIMGPNGSGKSTLANVLAGKADYTVTKGKVLFNGKDLLALEPDERAHAGVFLGFQHPVSIPGVSNVYFLKAAFNAIRKARGEAELDAMDFMTLVKEKLALLDMDSELIYRGVNDGFSGGEKKRNQIFQLLVLEPYFAILDETDSGLDIDALKMVAKGINTYRSAERGLLMITHYQRLLDYVAPDVIHVLADGKIIKTGDQGLAHALEAKGYAWLDGAREEAQQ